MTRGRAVSIKSCTVGCNRKVAVWSTRQGRLYLSPQTETYAPLVSLRCGVLIILAQEDEDEMTVCWSERDIVSEGVVKQWCTQRYGH